MPGAKPLLHMLMAVALAGAAQAQDRPSAQSRPLVFDDVTVVDVVQGALIRGQRVVVAGNRIQAMGKPSAVPKPQSAQVVKAGGKYLIPGLWDMHVHVWSLPDLHYPLFVANGVTGIREMSQTLPIDSLLRWRRQIITGERVGPRVIGTGGFLGGQVQPPLMIRVTTPAEARHVVDSLKAAGADFIKIRGGLSREVFFAVAAHARQVGIPLVGHLSDSVTIEEASDSGQLSLEHYAMVRQCTDSGAMPANSAQCEAVMARLVRNGTWITPTLAYLAFGNVDQLYRGAERVLYWPKAIREEATGGFMAMWRSGAARDMPRWLKLFQAGIRSAKRFGLPFLAGTDGAPMIWEVSPGFSLHDELVLLVQSGLTPLEALQAATLNPAKMLKATDSLGTVGVGKVADLVLLDANPLTDIHNTTTIRAVVANGRYFDRQELDQVLAEVRFKAE